jgi:hypothetical protein
MTDRYCDNTLCEWPAVKEVPISVERPSDGTRHFCASCEEAYSIGVQHGTITERYSGEAVAILREFVSDVEASGVRVDDPGYDEKEHDWPDLIVTYRKAKAIIARANGERAPGEPVALDPAEARKRAYVAAPFHCPYCGSEDIQAGEMGTPEGRQVWQAVECLDCGRHWDDEYTLTGIEEESEES